MTSKEVTSPCSIWETRATLMPMPRSQDVTPALVPITSDGQSLTSHLGSNILTITQNGIYDASGHPVSQATMQSQCPPGPGDPNTSNMCLAQHHFKTLLSCQPGSRIPDFHLILIGGYLGLAVIAAAVAWRLARRTSMSAG